MSLVGTIQPGTLERSLGQAHFENGLVARLLLAMPPRKRKHWTDAEVSSDTVDRTASMFEKLLKLRHNVNPNDEPVPVA